MIRRSLCVALVLLLSASVLAAAEPEAKKKTRRAPGSLSKKEAAEGFVRLFDGKTLEGWQGDTRGYKAENGVLVCLKEGGGNLYTAKEYGDFIFRFDFKLEPGGNNGVGLRTPREGNPAYVGMEIQILDDPHPMYKNLQPYQAHGSVYGVIPAKTGHLKPVGEWNSEEIHLKGRHIKVTLNGTAIVDADLPKPGEKTLDGAEHSGMGRDKGYLVFMGHGARVELRNLRIKEL